MHESPPDPTTTHRLFGHERVAAGYAEARPDLHPEVYARVRRWIPAKWPLGRGLDVGCGTGMSSVAMLELTRQVVGVDASVQMLERARRRERVHYLASVAEELPFGEGSFDLVAACGSIDWVDRQRFLPRAAELLVSGGWLVALDFGDTGASREMPELEGWYQEVFERRFPRPPSRDPMISREEAERFGLEPPEIRTFELPCSFTADGYADFLMTESHVIAAVEYGDATSGEVRGWLGTQLGPLFGPGARSVRFGGYIQSLRRR